MLMAASPNQPDHPHPMMNGGDVGQEQVDADQMEIFDMNQLLHSEIPACQSELLTSHQNLDLLATYCDENYTKNPDKLRVLEETKGYCTQSLASVAYQINNLAGNFIAVLDLQSKHLDRLERSLSNLNSAVDIHREKVARREIGNITSSKFINNQGAKIRRPTTEAPQHKFVRKGVDYSELDNIGHGIRIRTEEQPAVMKKNSISNFSGSGSDSSSIQSGGTLGRSSQNPVISGTGTLRGKPVAVPAAPMAPQHYHPGSLAMRSMQGERKKSDTSRNIEAVGLPIAYSGNEEPRYEMQRHNSRSSNRSYDQYSETASVSSGGQGSDYRLPSDAFNNGGPGSVKSGGSGSTAGGGDYRYPREAFRYAPDNATLQQRFSRKSSISSQQPPQPAYPPEDMEYVGGEFRPKFEPSFEPSPEQYKPYYNQPKPQFNKPPAQTQQQQPPQPNNFAQLQQQQMQQQQQQLQLQMQQQREREQQQQLLQQQQLQQQKLQQQQQQNQYHHHQQQKQHPQPQVTNLSSMAPSSHVPPFGAGVKNQPPPNLDKCEKVIALYDYTAEQDDELTFNEGQIIYVVKKNDDGWYEGLMPPTYDRGLFPGNYVEPVTYN